MSRATSQFARGSVMPLMLALIALMTLGSGCSRSHPTKENPPESTTSKKEIWTCSMHPQIREDHPGACPICGMALTPLRTSIPAEATNAPIFPTTEAQPKKTVVTLDAAQSSVSSIKTAPVELRMVQRRIDLFGEIADVSDRHTSFTWYYGGRVQKALINYNTTEVAAGTPILEVFSDEAIADQRAYLETLRQLWSETFYPRKNLEAQMSAIAQRLLKIGMTPTELTDLQKKGTIRTTFIIRAPQSGTIMGELPRAGERFTTDKVLFHLVPLDEVWFIADVYEQDLSLLKLGQEIKIHCSAHPEDVFIGKLVYIDRAVDPQKRTLKARFLVRNPKLLLLPQLSATGTLELGLQQSILSIPASAVINTGKRQLVYIETSPHTYELKKVKIGAEGQLSKGGSTRWVPILEGLKVGDNVVIEGAFLIDAEAQMRGLPASDADPSLKQSQ